MKFQFQDLSQMLTMDGHGVYVWSAVIVTLIIIIGLIVRPLLQHKVALNQIAQDLAREKLRKEVAGESN
ncbi:MAG: heme exporter protein CcmD [Proteobacteria bacterium]|jgi:heme exporter protein D|nr:heme exporter protein CcmD [Pseudomonadota bacterium]MDA1350872.1 heme exporter protein CcmD [Pseudomonadota bacterium]|tara:strand:- start:140 stop:346 length:207 start_codon:yes stop_codon:yes gene_type:complete